MSSVPERLKGRVRLERLCQRLRTLGTDAIVIKTANEVEHGASEAIDANSRVERGSSILELHEHRVLPQIESEQDGISSLQALALEVALRLLRLDAAEGGELRLVLGDVHDGTCTLLSHVILKQTAGSEQSRCQKAYKRPRLLTAGRRRG